jgi:hypothetical protein
MGSQVIVDRRNDPRFKISISPADRFDLIDSREKMGRFQELDRRAVIHDPLRMRMYESQAGSIFVIIPS